MKMQLSRRWTLFALAFTVIVMAAPSGGGISIAKTARPAVQQAINAPVPPSLPEKRQLSVAADAGLERLARLQLQHRPQQATGAEGREKIGNVFSATSWYVPPPPPPPRQLAPPPAPSAPPVPFTYIGRYEDAPMRLIILVNGERMYAVAEGDVIENTYRIERVAAGQVELTYLPLNIKQFLNTGEAL